MVITILELIEILRQFPQEAPVSITHCYQDGGMVKYDFFDLVSIEGNDEDPHKSADVDIWIKPSSVPGFVVNEVVK